MKKILILYIAFMFVGINAKAQLLTNTTWAVYDPLNSFIGYFHFESDTLSVSSDNILYSDASVYQETGINFTIVDLPGSSNACLLTDTGAYTFYIQNDTLLFNYISDLCFSRHQVISIFHWVQVSTAISETDANSFDKIYPNPTTQSIVIHSVLSELGSSFKITNLWGKIVFQGIINQQSTSVDLSELISGVYFVRIGASAHVIKMVKN